MNKVAYNKSLYWAILIFLPVVIYCFAMSVFAFMSGSMFFHFEVSEGFAKGMISAFKVTSVLCSIIGCWYFYKKYIVYDNRLGLIPVKTIMVWVGTIVVAIVLYIIARMMVGFVWGFLISSDTVGSGSESFRQMFLVSEIVGLVCALFGSVFFYKSKSKKIKTAENL